MRSSQICSSSRCSLRYVSSSQGMGLPVEARHRRILVVCHRFRACDWPRWDRDALLRADISRSEQRFKKHPRATGLRDIVTKMRQELSQGPLPLAFLCQLFLRDLHVATPLNLWPSDGSLAFFYDPSQNWGFDPEGRGHCRVFFVPEDEELVPVRRL